MVMICPSLISELKKLKHIKGPKVLHVITKKGKGLRQAEENQVAYHAPGKFDAETGDLLPKSEKFYTSEISRCIRKNHR